MREKVGTDYFCEVIREVLLDESRICELRVLPSATLGAENQAEKALRLGRIAESWTVEDVQSLLTPNESLINWQQSADTEEALATMPILHLRDIDGDPCLTNTEIFEQ